jgi:hypothetical protein
MKRSEYLAQTNEIVPQTISSKLNVSKINSIQKNKTVIKCTVVLLMFIVFTPCLMAQAELKKKISKNFTSNSLTHVSISNSFGKVEIKEGSDNQVNFDVEISVKNVSESKAQKILDNIEIQFTSVENTIEAITKVDDDLLHNMNDEDRKITIDYTVLMPSDLYLSVVNKFGDITMGNYSGQLDLEVKYGNLHTGNLTRGDNKPLNEIKLGYSNGYINDCNWAKIILKYSNINLNSGKALVVVSKYSKFIIDKASSVVADAEFDTYEIGSLSNFVGKFSYSNVKIASLSNKYDVESAFTDIKVKYIPRDFESIRVENKYGSVRLAIDETASYTIDANAKFADVKCADSHGLSRIHKNTSTKLSGRVGSDASPKASVFIDTNFGEVDLE